MLLSSFKNVPFFIHFGLPSLPFWLIYQWEISVLFFIPTVFFSALWADRFGVKSLMMWGRSFCMGVCILTFGMCDDFDVLVASAKSGLILFNLNALTWAEIMAFYKGGLSFKDSLKAQSFLGYGVALVVSLSVAVTFLIRRVLFPTVPVVGIAFGSAFLGRGVDVIGAKAFSVYTRVWQKKPIANSLKLPFQKEYIFSALSIGSTLGWILAVLDSKDSNIAWISLLIGYAGGILGTWIKCRQGSNSIPKDITGTAKSQFNLYVLKWSLLFIASARLLGSAFIQLQQKAPDLMVTLNSFQKDFSFFTEVCTTDLATILWFVTGGLILMHIAFFSIVFFKIPSRAMVIYHYTLFQMNDKGKNHGALAAMVWWAFLAVMAGMWNKGIKFFIS